MKWLVSPWGLYLMGVALVGVGIASLTPTPAEGLIFIGCGLILAAFIKAVDSI